MNLDHVCKDIENTSIDKFLQIGEGKGKDVLILGEAPAPNGWRVSGKAFYTPTGKLLPTGKNLNKLLEPLDLKVEMCSFTELVKCFVGKNRNLLIRCGEKCWPLFIKQLESNKFKLIIILGVKTLEIFNKLTDRELKIGNLAETEINGIRYKILPIYHPSPIAPFNHKNNVEIFNRSYSDIRKIWE